MDDDSTPTRRRSGRLGRLGIATIAAVVGVLSVTGAVAMATSRGDDPPTTAASPPSTVHDHAAVAGQDKGQDEGRAAGRRARHKHEHPALTPYDERYDDATGAQQQAADDLQEQVAKTIAKYEDVSAATAAGFLPPRRPNALLAHYVNLDAVRDGKILDPSAPEGLVYYTGGPKPVLLGAFFVALRGETVPTGTGGIVVWHSHNPGCTAFFATPEAPCTAQRRMLHVWTFDQVTLVARRTGKPVTIELTDPFGAPFGASVRKAA